MASNRDLKVTFDITSLALIRPGDTLVLSFGRYIDAEECKRVSFQVAAELPGVHAYPSEANMILIRVPDAQKTFEGLKLRNVLVKNVSRMHPLLTDCLRLTVGTADENRLLLAALKESLTTL